MPWNYKSVAVQAGWTYEVYYFIDCSIYPTDLEKKKAVIDISD